MFIFYKGFKSTNKHFEIANRYTLYIIKHPLCGGSDRRIKTQLYGYNPRLVGRLNAFFGTSYFFTKSKSSILKPTFVVSFSFSTNFLLRSLYLCISVPPSLPHVTLHISLSHSLRLSFSLLFFFPSDLSHSTRQIHVTVI